MTASERHAEARRGAQAMRRRAFADWRQRFHVSQFTSPYEVTSATALGHPDEEPYSAPGVIAWADEKERGCPAWS